MQVRVMAACMESQADILECTASAQSGRREVTVCFSPMSMVSTGSLKLCGKAYFGSELQFILVISPMKPLFGMIFCFSNRRDVFTGSSNVTCS